MYKMFIDDERFPVDPSMVVVRSFDEAVAYAIEHGCPVFISFDHDLGMGKTGYDFANWLIDTDLDNLGFMPETFHFDVHSQNPIGARNIREALNGYIAFRNASRHVG